MPRTRIDPRAAPQHTVGRRIRRIYEYDANGCRQPIVNGHLLRVIQIVHRRDPDRFRYLCQTMGGARYILNGFIGDELYRPENKRPKTRAIVRARFRLKDRFTVPGFLESLGIKFRRGGLFWTTNESEIEHILVDFRAAAKARTIELHPDRHGGDPAVLELCLRFRQYVERAEKCFKDRRIGLYS